MKIINLPENPSHIINYVETEISEFFIRWVVNKMRQDVDCEGYEESDITNTICEIVFYPHKHNKLFQEYLSESNNG